MFLVSLLCPDPQALAPDSLQEGPIVGKGHRDRGHYPQALFPCPGTLFITQCLILLSPFLSLPRIRYQQQLLGQLFPHPDPRRIPDQDTVTTHNPNALLPALSWPCPLLTPAPSRPGSQAGRVLCDPRARQQTLGTETGAEWGTSTGCLSKTFPLSRTPVCSASNTARSYGPQPCPRSQAQGV